MIVQGFSTRLALKRERERREHELGDHHLELSSTWAVLVGLIGLAYFTFVGFVLWLIHD